MKILELKIISDTKNSEDRFKSILYKAEQRIS